MLVYLALCESRSFHKCCLFKIFDLKYHAKGILMNLLASLTLTPASEFGMASE